MPAMAAPDGFVQIVALAQMQDRTMAGRCLKRIAWRPEQHIDARRCGQRGPKGAKLQGKDRGRVNRDLASFGQHDPAIPPYLRPACRSGPPCGGFTPAAAIAFSMIRRGRVGA